MQGQTEAEPATMTSMVAAEHTISYRRQAPIQARFRYHANCTKSHLKHNIVRVPRGMHCMSRGRTIVFWPEHINSKINSRPAIGKLTDRGQAQCRLRYPPGIKNRFGLSRHLILPLQSQSDH